MGRSERSFESGITHPEQKRVIIKAKEEQRPSTDAAYIRETADTRNPEFTGHGTDEERREWEDAQFEAERAKEVQAVTPEVVALLKERLTQNESEGSHSGRMDWVTKEIILHDEKMQHDIAERILEQAENSNREIAELNVHDWKIALSEVIEERRQELSAAGIITEKDGLLIQEVGQRRPDEAERLKIRELQVLSEVNNKFASKSKMSEDAFQYKHRPVFQKYFDEAFEKAVTDGRGLDHMDARTRLSILEDSELRNSLLSTLEKRRNETDTYFDSLDNVDWSNAFHQAITERKNALEQTGIVLSADGDILESGRKPSAQELREIKKLQGLIEVEASVADELPETRHGQRPTTRTLSRVTARASAPHAPAIAPARTSFWNRTANKVGKFLTGLGIWLGGTSGGEFDQARERATEAQESNRPLPAYARAEAPSEDARELPSQEYTFIEEESAEAMKRPEDHIEFSEAEPAEVMAGAHMESTTDKAIKSEVAAAVRAASRNVAPRPTAARRAERTPAAKRARATKFDADAFMAAGKEATRGVVGTPERTRDTVEKMRQGKRPLSSEAQDAIDAVREAASKLSSTTELKSRLDRAMGTSQAEAKPATRKEVAKPETFRRPINLRSTERQPSVSRGLAAVRESSKEHAAGDQEIRDAIKQVREDYHAGKISQEKAADLVRQFKQLL